jgi:ubiquinone/menaquinone biosynthesis C-methylase UbiE
MHAYLKKAKRLGREISLWQSSAESLDVGDSIFNAVVSTFVLCSVSDPAVALPQTLHVLKPRGGFDLIDHVAAPRANRKR